MSWIVGGGISLGLFVFTVDAIFDAIKPWGSLVSLLVILAICIIALYFIITWWANWEFPDEDK